MNAQVRWHMQKDHRLKCLSDEAYDFHVGHLMRTISPDDAECTAYCEKPPMAEARTHEMIWKMV